MAAAGHAERYTAVAIVLHWAIAAALLSNLLLGWWMGGALHDADLKSRAIAAFQLHKSLGLTILVLSLMRLGWRLTHTAPPFPDHMPDWERWAARLTHGTFYVLMILVPLSGWTYVSAQWRGDAPLNVPTLWFGLFEVPHLFDAHALTNAERKEIADRTFLAHYWLAWSMGALFVAHVSAALKHHFINRDRVLAQMLPAVDTASADAGDAGRRAVLRGAAALVFAGLAALGYLWLRGPAASADGAAATAATSVSGSWVVDSTSRIEFTGSNSGSEFRGIWTKWSADIRYDAANPEASTITATIDTASAKTGVSMQEEALPQAEWFDTAKFPSAVFKSTKVGADGVIEGTLTIKDRALPITGLKAVFDNGVLKITGHAEIDRKVANLGLESDANGDYVSLKIGVDVNVTARAPK